MPIASGSTAISKMYVGSTLVSAAYANSASLLFNPSSLFAASEPGVWYDPSDFARYMNDRGPELVTNGDFGTGNLSGWTNPDTAPSVTVFSSGGAMMTAAAGSVLARLRQAINISAGTYEVSLVASGVTGTPQCNLSLGSGTSGDTDYGSIAILNNGTYRSIITVNGPTLGLAFIAGNASGGSIVLDNISVKEITKISTATMFQDAAGTTPVTAMGQPVGLMLDKRLGLVRGPESVTNGSNEDGLFSISGNTGGVTAIRVPSPSGSGFVALGESNTSASAAHTFKSLATFIPANTTVEISFDVFVPTGGIATARMFDNGDGSWFGQSTTVKDTWVTLRAIRPAKTSAWQLGIGDSAPSSITIGVAAFYIDNLSVRELPGNHATQPTAINRPVLQIDGNGKYYLAFNGTNSSMVTPSIDFTTTDKMTVVAGFRKMSDAARGILIELSTAFTNAGSFAIEAPFGTNSTYRVTVKASSASATFVGYEYSSPISSVLTISANNAGPTFGVRVNRAEQVTSATQNTGAFGNYPLYIGARAGTGAYFNGWFYGLVVRGALSTAMQIDGIENLINTSTGAY